MFPPRALQTAHNDACTCFNPQLAEVALTSLQLLTKAAALCRRRRGVGVELVATHIQGFAGGLATGEPIGLDETANERGQRKRRHEAMTFTFWGEKIQEAMKHLGVRDRFGEQVQTPTEIVMPLEPDVDLQGFPWHTFAGCFPRAAKLFVGKQGSAKVEGPRVPQQLPKGGISSIHVCLFSASIACHVCTKC